MKNLLELIRSGGITTDEQAEETAADLVDRWHEDKIEGDLYAALGLTHREYQAWTTGGVSLLTIANWRQQGYPSLDREKPWFRISGNPGAESVGYLTTPRANEVRAATSPCYRTRRIAEYPGKYSRSAERIFRLVEAQVSPGHALRRDGSWSVIAQSTNETVGKLIIYVAERVKASNWPLKSAGVYILTRVNGEAALRIWGNGNGKAQGTIRQKYPEYFRRMDRDCTIGVYRTCDRRFAFFKVQQDDDPSRIAVYLADLSRL